MTESAGGSLARVFENFDPSVTGCGTFTTSSSSPYIDITLPNDSNVSAVMVHVNNQSAKWQVKKVSPEVLDPLGIWQSCVKIKYTNLREYNVGIHSCGFTGNQLRLNLRAYGSFSNPLTICKIGVFGTYTASVDCSTATASFTENALTVSSTSFDLLSETSKSIDLPVVSIEPASCSFTTSWTVHLKSDDTDMVNAMPSVFSISGT